MSSDQQFIQDQERKTRERDRLQRQEKKTMEMVELERQNVALPVWQQRVVNGLAVVGGVSIIYLIVTQVF